MIRERIRGSLTAKLFTAQLLVIIAGSLTLVLVAVSLAPGVFHGHLRQVPSAISATVTRHIELGFRDAVLVSLGVAIASAFLTALAVSWFLSRRVVTPIQTLAVAAQRIARGAYSQRAPVAGPDELGALGMAFNEMATSLESAEIKRRELLVDIAHELRTPLATVEGYLEGLADGVVAADAGTWDVLETEIRRLRRLVDDLQKVSRAEARQLDLRLVPTKPEALLEAAFAAAEPAFAAKGVHLEVKLSRDLPVISVDGDRIGEVLANLLDNALRYTSKGGRVELTAACNAKEVGLAVADTGCGIAVEHLDRIFERFYRTDPARERASGGSGIGLAIARAIVAAHGALIRAESAGIGYGARFIVTFPLRATRARESALQ